MKNNTFANSNPESYVSQPKKLSFYEENYILEPEDFDDEDSGYQDIDENPGFLEEGYGEIYIFN